MGYESFIARRYVRSQHRVRFVSVINLISIIGITVGVAALVIILSVFNGFSGVVTSVLVSFDPHVRIEKKGGMAQHDYKAVASVLKDDERVQGFSPFLAGKAMLVTRSFGQVVILRGVDERAAVRGLGIRDKIVLGSFSLADTAHVGSVVLGLTLADRLGTVVGSEIAVVTPQDVGVGLMPFGGVGSAKLRVAGIYESNNRDYDANYAYVSLGSAQRLFKATDRYSGVEVRLREFDAAERMKSYLVERLPDGFQVQTWYDLHRDLFSVMKIERWVAYILVSLIIFVSTFNLLGSLTMAVIEKKRDIGVLKSMGAKNRSIKSIFIWQGVFVGVVGMMLGALLGLGVLWLQIEYNIVPLDTTIYIIPGIPVEIHPMDFVAVGLAAFILAILAAYIPAKRAAKTIPMEAIRWE